MLNAIRKTGVFIILWSCTWLCLVEAGAGETARPLVPGERLTFDLSWGRIGAGSAVLTVLPMATLNGSPAYHFKVTAKSSKTIDRIFRIRDRLESYADAGMTHSLLYKQKIREGGYRKDRVITFDWENDRLEYISNNSKPKYRPVMPGTFDPLAAFFYLRLQTLEPSTQVACPITDGKRNVIGKANILRREKIEVQKRVYDTYVIQPVMDEVELFSGNQDSAIRLWMTADEKRLPVLIESRVVFGYFRAELRRVEYLPPELEKNGTASSKGAMLQ